MGRARRSGEEMLILVNVWIALGGLLSQLGGFCLCGREIYIHVPGKHVCVIADRQE